MDEQRAEGRRMRRSRLFRLLALADLAAGLSYLSWRYARSLNTDPRALWFAILLVAAETYAFLDSVLFMVTLWKPKRRVAPEPPEGVLVDVYVTTYDEPVDLLRLTVEAAVRIDWSPLRVYVLDDGARPAVRDLCASLSCGYLTRGEEWKGRARHAKAGNVNNALLQTAGEFVLILDADQIPVPAILRRTLGYFADPGVAFVQTPQYFYNLPPGDPFGCDAPLFYGPIQQGKDGWNAAFFCGSNAVLRREALMRLGLSEYARKVEAEVAAAAARMSRAGRRRGPDPARGKAARAVLAEAARRARALMEAGGTVEAAAEVLRRGGREADRALAAHDLAGILRDLDGLGRAGDVAAASAAEAVRAQMPAIAAEVTDRTAGPGSYADGFDGSRLMARSGEALAVEALSTVSVTEDMATALKLHSQGWKSVFHPEILAYGLAPEDLGAALTQRLRWAQGTLQVLFREPVLFRKGLRFGQRLQYLTTINSYFSGFAQAVFLLSPVFFLFTGIAPVKAWSLDFFLRFVPFFLLNKGMFRFAAGGLSTKRGEQYSMGLFPLWIRAVFGALFHGSSVFQVTPKVRREGNYLSRVKVQAAFAALSVAAAAYGVTRVLLGYDLDWIGVAMNAGWACYNTAMLSVILRAALYRAPAGWDPKPPAFLFPKDEKGAP